MLADLAQRMFLTSLPSHWTLPIVWELSFTAVWILGSDPGESL